MPIVEYRVELVRLAELRPHEDVDKGRVADIARSLARIGVLYRPLIIEEETNTVIDGHHRIEALKLLGARYAPVVRASYDRDIAGIQAPVRRICVEAATPEDALYRAASLLEEGLERGPSRIILRSGAHTATLRGSLYSIYNVVDSLERKLARPYGCQGVLLLPEPLNRDAILGAALEGLLYPRKSSIHVTPLKKLYHPVKLRLLEDGVPRALRG